MEKNFFKKEKPFENYSYRKSRIKGNQQTNILKTYNNINNEIIINIKNNEKYSTDIDKKCEVRRIRLKLPNELVQKKEGLDFLDLNLRNTHNSTHSDNKIIPNSVIYQQNLENKKFKLEQLINDFSIRNKFDSSRNINNTFQYTENNLKNNDIDILFKKNEKKLNQIPINKNKDKYYQKPFHIQNKIIYHKINNLSYRNKKENINNNTARTNININNINNNNKKIILEKIKKPKIYKFNPITNLSHSNVKETDSNKIIIKKLTPNKIKYKKIKPKEIKEDLREKLLPINVNRQKKFYSNNISNIKDDESNNNLNNSNIIAKTRNSFNRKTFRFLVNQTNKNNDLSTSFSKCYNNNSQKKPLLKSSQVFNFNDSMSYNNTFNENDSNNDSIYNNNNNIETNIKKPTRFNTQKTLINKDKDKDDPILIYDDTDNKKRSEIIPHKKFILSALNTPKYFLMNHISRINTHLSSSTLNSLNLDLISQPRNISAISLSGINLDLYYLEKKMKLVFDKITNYEKCSKECYNYLQFYFEKNFDKELLKPIKKEENIVKMMNYIKLEITCYFLCYNICLGDNFKITEILLKSIFDILFNNFMLYLCFIVSQCENKTDNIIIVLKKIIKDNLKSFSHNFIIDENKYIDTILNNSKSIIDYYNIIICNIYNKNKEIKLSTDMIFPEYVYNILNSNNKIESNEINESQCEKIISIFFREVIKYFNELNIDFFQKFFDNILCFNNEKNNDNKDLSNNNIEYNYIDYNKTQNKKYYLPAIKDDKEFSLILDLEDTLIHSKRDFNFRKKLNLCNINKKIIILRPFLFEFLEEMQTIFELILFSSNTPEYVNPIVNKIQKDKKYFDFVLYRHHITLDDEGNNVKNLEFLGRDLKKVIIIDDIPRYFKLQKENGINIKPFYGNENKDGNTLKILGEILKRIRKDADESKDIRISLNKFRESLYPHVIEKLEMN